MTLNYLLAFLSSLLYSYTNLRNYMMPPCQKLISISFQIFDSFLYYTPFTFNVIVFGAI